jgi:hypothetical protein
MKKKDKNDPKKPVGGKNDKQHNTVGQVSAKSDGKPGKK